MNPLSKRKNNIDIYQKYLLITENYTIINKKHLSILNLEINNYNLDKLNINFISGLFDGDGCLSV